MKTAAKVFLILAIIGAVFYILSGIFCFLVGTMIYANLQAIEPDLVAVENNYNLPAGIITSGLLFGLGAFLCVWAVICIIVSSNSLRVLNEADRKSRTIGWGIATLIFSDLLAGIFMLAIPKENFPLYRAATPASVADPYEQLQHIQELYDKGIISYETYDEKKKKYLDML